MVSTHYIYDRQDREMLIQTIGYGYTVKMVIVDRGHRNGPEIHSISSTGIITIQTQRTHKIVTRLIARPAQITRYYNEDEQIPAGLLELAREHTRMGYNER